MEISAIDGSQRKAARVVGLVYLLVIPLALFAEAATTLRNILERERLFRLGTARNLDYVGLLFWGLGSTICSYLWFKPSYIPRALAAWGAIASAWCAAYAFAFFIFPRFGKAVNLYWFDSPIGIFEIATSLWLLFKGLRPSGMTEPDKAGHRAQAGAA
jgi:hypothetical protein